MQESFVEIPLELIDRPAVSDRLEITEEEIDEMAESIKQRTQLSAIQVNEGNGRFEIVFGDRRFLAIKKLGWPTIKAVVRKYSKEDVIIDRATENLGRKNLSVIEEARSCLRLHDAAGLSWDQIGKRVGVSGGVIKRRVALLKMEDRIIDAVHKGQIGYGIAEELGRCADDAHRRYLLDLAIEHGVTVAIMRGWVNEWIQAQSRSTVDIGGTGGVRFPGTSEAIYRACQLCRGPVDINKMVRIECCEECGQAIMKIVRGEGG